MDKRFTEMMKFNRIKNKVKKQFKKKKDIPSGKLTQQWNIIIFSIGNTSSIRVHVPASYVSLPRSE